jgi:hypothetical protein
MSDVCNCGPLRHATLIVADAQLMVQAYAALGLVVVERSVLGDEQAQAWGQAQLAGLGVTWLAPLGAAPLLRLIELPGTLPRPTRLSHGWLALELLVRDVDALAPRLADSGFRIVGAPADLAFSPSIRAMQVTGPAGEMLYLTQVKLPVPPFELPLSADLPATQDLGALFIAVMSVPSRAALLQACAAMAPRSTLQFDTKVTVLNQALARPSDHVWPVATLQWHGASLFEIDEVIDPAVTTPLAGQLPEGLAWVSMDAGGDGRLQELAPGVWLERLIARPAKDPATG